MHRAHYGESGIHDRQRFIMSFGTYSPFSCMDRNEYFSILNQMADLYSGMEEWDLIVHKIELNRKTINRLRKAFLDYPGYLDNVFYGRHKNLYFWGASIETDNKLKNGEIRINSEPKYGESFISVVVGLG